jgi:hypothetical protein
VGHDPDSLADRSADLLGRGIGILPLLVFEMNQKLVWFADDVKAVAVPRLLILAYRVGHAPPPRSAPTIRDLIREPPLKQAAGSG